MRRFLRLDLLLVFVPVAAVLHFMGGHDTWLFVTACVAIIPVAGWMGRATEHLAARAGDGVGGLLNATFGNAAELIIALAALRAGQTEVVKASITGSIIGNILLVMGAAFLAGGLRHRTMRFNARGARTWAAMLTLAAMALVVPAVFHALAGAGGTQLERNLSLEISIVLIITYACTLWFSLRTHRELFAAEHADQASSADETEHHDHWSVKKSVVVLVAATAVVAVLAEWLVHALGHATEALGLNAVFVGVVVVAVVGNAAEHSTAILMALKNRGDLAVGIALGSSVQVALLVAPVLVFASYFIADQPLDLVFSPAEVLAVVLAVAIANQVTSDGESHWLEGVQLLSVYAILAAVFYLLPAPAPTAVVGH